MKIKSWNLKFSRLRVILLASSGAVAVTVASLLLFGGRDEGDTPSNLTVEEIYRGASQTLADSGAVYYVEIDLEGDAIIRYEGLNREWVDPSTQVAREESKLEYLLPSGERQAAGYSAIYAATATYRVDEDGSSEVRPNLCHGADLAASRVLGCPRFNEELTTSVLSGSFNGRSVLILLKEGTSTGSDETFTFVERLYIDPKTYLPVAMESKGEVDFHQGKPTHVEGSYNIEWVSRDSLPEDFFEPTTIGFEEGHAEAAIRHAQGLQVYWVGREFTAPDVEPLVLRSSYAAPGRGHPYRYSLTYARAANPYDPPFLTLEIFFRDIWEATPVSASQAAFIGEAVILFSEGTFQGSPDRILTPDALEQLMQGLRPYPEP